MFQIRQEIKFIKYHNVCLWHTRLPYKKKKIIDDKKSPLKKSINFLASINLLVIFVAVVTTLLWILKLFNDNEAKISNIHSLRMKRKSGK